MPIAQVTPLDEKVPLKLYGGTERIVSYLTDELVRQGHQVTLFASGDSVTTAHLIAPCQRALRLDRHCIDPLAHHVTGTGSLRLPSIRYHSFPYGLPAFPPVPTDKT